MFQAYIPPTKWYRRAIQIRITLWPRWLAQFLCDHSCMEEVNPQGWDFTSVGVYFNDDYLFTCRDCHHLLRHVQGHWQKV